MHRHELKNDMTPPIYLDRACPTCGSTSELLVHWHEKDRYLAPLGKGLARGVTCRRCATVYQNPRVSDASLSHLYQNDYRGTDANAYPDEAYFRERASAMQIRGNYIKRRLPQAAKQSLRLLDIGCAAGMLLNEFKPLGWDCQGIEPTPGYARYAREKYGLKVDQGLFTERSFPDIKFDAILMVHVLEHIPDPLAFLKLALSRLAPEGSLYLEVPHLYALRTANQISGLFHSTHLQLYTPKTLRRLLSQLGREILFVENNADPECRYSVRAIVSNRPTMDTTAEQHCHPWEPWAVYASFRWWKLRNTRIRPFRTRVGTALKRRIPFLARLRPA